jgi:hypothetical protein
MTGNGAFTLPKKKARFEKNAQAGFERVKALDYAKYKIVWLPAAPANTWSIAVARRGSHGPQAHAGGSGLWLATRRAGVFKPWRRLSSVSARRCPRSRPRAPLQPDHNC